MLRLLARTHSAPNESLVSTSSSLKSNSRDAVIVIQPGGRVEYLSTAARPFFNLLEDESFDLERLARHVRPSDDFIDLCVAPGVRRVSINGKPVEISSYEVPGAYPRMLISVRGKEVGSATAQNNSEDSDEILRVATEFGQAIAASLDLNTTVRSILDHVGRLANICLHWQRRN